MPLALHREIRKRRKVSVNDFESVFFDDRVGEDFLGDLFELLLSFVTIPAVEIEDEELALPDVFDGGIAQAGEGMLDSLALRIENGALWHDPNVCFHALIITLPGESSRR
jgi:hypothetical protein